MFYIEKTIEISACHFLNLDYESACKQLHGHNWVITIYCKSEKLNEFGMIEDFSKIKKRIIEKLDHKNLNEVLPFNPTAELIAYYIVNEIKTAYKCKVIESKNNIAIYEK